MCYSEYTHTHTHNKLDYQKKQKYKNSIWNFVSRYKTLSFKDKFIMKHERQKEYTQLMATIHNVQVALYSLKP